MEKKSIIVYGCGKCWNDSKCRLKCLYEIKYVCDRKFEEQGILEFEGIPVISKDEIQQIDTPLVIICLYNLDEKNKIKQELESSSCQCKYYDEVLPEVWGDVLDYDDLRTMVKNGIYEDPFGNKLIFRGDIPKKIRVLFCGVCSTIVVGKNVYSAKKLYVECGTKGEVVIGDNSTFYETYIMSSWEKITIGCDCMFSFGIYVRNTDAHHIYSSIDGSRINYSKPIYIDDHVWVGQNALCLPGFQIGKESIVGAGAVSSSKFSNNVIVAGNPAKVIRENVTWGRENAYIYDNDFM
ncbi:MAG: acyltransferase [Agathobacter sp.]|nr:acyltransferase [Agathobacter sp.]